MLSPVQEKLLSMLQWFHGFCVSNNIQYYALGGTLLGAVRHKGFIPWDDDVDVGIPRKDYKKLMSIFTHQIDHYLLETPYSGNDDFLYTYAKLYDTDTTQTEHIRKDCRRGVYIDVFPLDGIGDTEQEAIRNFKKFDRRNMFLMTRVCAIRKERSWYKNLSIILSRMIPSAFVDEKKLSIELDKLAESMNRESSSYVANLMGTYRAREIVEKTFLGEPTLYQFEDMLIYGPEQYDAYLTHVYGNWRELPSEEKRKIAHDYIELDLHKSYLEKT